jgi:DNA-binding NtrC family response regulator
MAARGQKGAEPSRTISLPARLPYKEAREQAAQAVDQVYLRELLSKHGGNHTRAAEEAGIDRKTFSARVAQALGDQEESPGG